MLQAVAEFRVDALRERVKELLASEKRLLDNAEAMQEMPDGGLHFEDKELYERWIVSPGCHWQGFKNDLRDRVLRYTALLEMLDLTTGDTIQLDTDVVLNVLLGE